MSWTPFEYIAGKDFQRSHQLRLQAKWKRLPKHFLGLVDFHHDKNVSSFILISQKYLRNFRLEKWFRTLRILCRTERLLNVRLLRSENPASPTYFWFIYGLEANGKEQKRKEHKVSFQWDSFGKTLCFLSEASECEFMKLTFECLSPLGFACVASLLYLFINREGWTSGGKG